MQLQVLLTQAIFLSWPSEILPYSPLSLLVDLLESSFSHFRTTELSLIFNLTLKQTAVHLFSLLREGRNFQQWISGKQLFQGDIFSQAVCRVNTNPSNTNCAKSLSPDQIIAPLLEKSWQIIPELQISGLGRKDIRSKTNWILQYFTNPPKYLITKPKSDLDSFYPTPAAVSQINIKKQMTPICWK